MEKSNEFLKLSGIIQKLYDKIHKEKINIGDNWVDPDRIISVVFKKYEKLFPIEDRHLFNEKLKQFILTEIKPKFEQLSERNSNDTIDDTSTSNDATVTEYSDIEDEITDDSQYTDCNTFASSMSSRISYSSNQNGNKELRSLVLFLQKANIKVPSRGDQSDDEYMKTLTTIMQAYAMPVADLSDEALHRLKIKKKVKDLEMEQLKLTELIKSDNIITCQKHQREDS